MTDIADHIAVIETTTLMGWYTDRREWAKMSDVFAPKVQVDYQSLNGQEPGVVALADLMAGWSETLGRLALTQHLITGHLVTLEGDTATVIAQIQATHIGEPGDGRRWVLGGDYRFDLTRTPEGWRIHGITLQARWETGDRALIGLD